MKKTPRFCGKSGDHTIIEVKLNKYKQVQITKSFIDGDVPDAKTGKFELPTYGQQIIYLNRRDIQMILAFLVELSVDKQALTDFVKAYSESEI